MREGKSWLRRTLVALVAALGISGSMIVSGASPALAGYNGQQIQIASYENFNVYKISGWDNNWNWVTDYRRASPYWGGHRYYHQVGGLYWKERVTVEVWHTQTGYYRSMNCDVPPWQWPSNWTSCDLS